MTDKNNHQIILIHRTVHTIIHVYTLKNSFRSKFELFLIFFCTLLINVLSFKRVQSSNQKPVSEIHSNLVPLTDPCVAIKTENIYNHQLYLQIHLTDVTNNNNSISFKPYQYIKNIALELWPSM